MNADIWVDVGDEGIVQEAPKMVSPWPQTDIKNAVHFRAVVETSGRDYSGKWRSSEGMEPDGGVAIYIRREKPPFFKCVIKKEEFTDELYQEAIRGAKFLINCAYPYDAPSTSGDVAELQKSYESTVQDHARLQHRVKELEAQLKATAVDAVDLLVKNSHLQMQSAPNPRELELIAFIRSLHSKLANEHGISFGDGDILLRVFETRVAEKA